MSSRLIDTHSRRSHQEPMKCPHCGGQAYRRSSRDVSETMREAAWICLNTECGCTFGTRTEIYVLFSLPAVPKPGINIPLSSHVKRSLLTAHLEHAGAIQCRTSVPQQGDIFDTA